MRLRMSPTRHKAAADQIAGHLAMFASRDLHGRHSQDAHYGALQPCSGACLRNGGKEVAEPTLRQIL